MDYTTIKPQGPTCGSVSLSYTFGRKEPIIENILVASIIESSLHAFSSDSIN